MDARLAWVGEPEDEEGCVMPTPGCLNLDGGVCHGRESNDEECGPEGARLQRRRALLSLS